MLNLTVNLRTLEEEQHFQQPTLDTGKKWADKEKATKKKKKKYHTELTTQQLSKRNPRSTPTIPPNHREEQEIS